MVGDWYTALVSLAQARSAYADWQRQACTDLLLGQPPLERTVARASAASSCPLPEISLELARVSQIGARYRPIAAKRLAWQMGARSVPPAQGPYLRRLRRNVLSDVRGPYDYKNDLSARLVSRRRGFTILLQCPGLFQDFLPKDLYPHEDDSPAPCSTEDILDDALIRLGQNRDLNHLIAIITPYMALVPELPIEQRQSFNCRLTYPGVIFLGRYHDPADLAADILHEFLHQLLWMAAWQQPRDWLPVGSDYTIRSPLTDREKDAAVMVHACLIYALIYHLRFLIGLSETRAANLGSASKSIADQLMFVPGLGSHPATLQILAIAEQCRMS